MKRLLEHFILAALGSAMTFAPAYAATRSVRAVAEAEATATKLSQVPSAAPTALYANLGTDAGDHLFNGGMTTSGTTRYTSLVCSPLTLSQPGPQLITGYSVSLYNGNATAYTPTGVAVAFYDTTGAGGGPGGILGTAGNYYAAGTTWSGIALPANSAYTFNASPNGYTAGVVQTPTLDSYGKVWACVSFSGAAASLPNLGLEKFANSPTAGTTTDTVFVSTIGASTLPLSNPVGTITNGGGNVFGWSLTTLGTNVMVDTYQTKTSAGATGTTSYGINSATGVAQHFAGYAATISAPPHATGSWNITGMALYPACTVGNYTDVQAKIQFWDTFNGSTAADVFANSTPIASTTVDIGPFNCLSATAIYPMPVRFPTPISIARSTSLGITVQYFTDSGAGLVNNGSMMEVLASAASGNTPAVGANASTGATGWYKSASDRADLNFTGSTDYVTGTRVHLAMRVYANEVGVPTHSVTTSTSGPGAGTISPSGVNTVSEGATVTYTMTPAAGSHLVAVTGTCGGTLAGSTFTTSPVNADCTVNAFFALGTGTNGVYYSPAVNHALVDNGDGTTINFTTHVLDDTGPFQGPWDVNFYDSTSLQFYAVSTYAPKFVLSGAIPAVLTAGSVVGPASTFSSGSVAAGANWTAGANGYLGVQFNCNGRFTFPVPGNVCYGYIHMTTTSGTGYPATIVEFGYDADGNAVTIPASGTVTYTVSATAGANGLIDPASQSVMSGSTATLTLYPDAGYHVASVTGCGGTYTSGNTYTTGSVTADCAVTATFAPTVTRTVSTSANPVAGGVFTPTSRTVNDGETTTFSVAANSGYHIDTVTGCGGSFNSGTGVYTTGAISADCTVTANFMADTGNPNLVCSAPLNHPIATDINGTSINFSTGAIVDAGPTSGYDFNPYGTGGKLAFYWQQSTVGAGVATSSSTASWTVLHAGDTVGASSIFSRSTGAAPAWDAGVDGYLGVKFDCSSIPSAPASGVCYGYVHMTSTGPNGFPANIVDYCYDKTGADVTIAGGTAGGAPSVTKAFSPAQVLTNADSTATITLTNPNATAATLTAALVDTLPSGLVATAASTTCGGSVSYTAGSITLASGATIPAGSCKITATVHAAAESSYVNTIHAGDLQTSAGNNAADASATLIVSNTLPFPQPYCSVSFPSNVEPISRVALTGIDNPSDPTLNGSPALENFLSVAGGALSRTGVYTATVEGNTDGNFTAKIMVYIDWNQNGTFDAGEGFALSDLVNSTGTDGKQSTGDITVPPDALLGATRMRVIKRFNTVPDACNAAGYGQAEDYTVVVDANPPPQPNADVTPFSFTMTAEEGASATDTMVVHNTGPGRLTFDIKRALPDSRALPKAGQNQFNKLLASRSTTALNDIVKLQDAGMLEQLRRNAGTKTLGMKGHPIELAAGQFSQMADNTPESLNGVACPSGGTSWWRRFYFSEHAGVGASTRISQVTIGTEDGAANTATVNVYSIPHGVTVDTIPLDQLTLLGTGTGAVGGTLTTSTIELDEPVDIADTSAVDLVVEYNVAATAGFYPAGNSTTQTHPTFISSTTCGIADPEDAANVGDGFPDFHIIMIVDYGDVTPPGTGCGSPSNVAWLSATPNTGTINGIGTKNVTVKANAASLTTGTYGGLLCVNTNDVAHPQFEIPVTLTVTPNIANDTIFKDGFDGAPQCEPQQLLADTSFEASLDGTGPWASTSSNFGTALCDVAGCGSGSGSAGPRTGSVWAWLGGSSNAETATASQSVVIPSGGSRFLNFYLWIGSVAGNATNMDVKVDGNTVQSYPEPSAAEGDYTLRSVDLSTYADGASHTIGFNYSGISSNYNVDDVTLDCAAAAPLHH